MPVEEKLSVDQRGKIKLRSRSGTLSTARSPMGVSRQDAVDTAHLLRYHKTWACGELEQHVTGVPGRHDLLGNTPPEDN